MLFTEYYQGNDCSSPTTFMGAQVRATRHVTHIQAPTATFMGAQVRAEVGRERRQSRSSLLMVQSRLQSVVEGRRRIENVIKAAGELSRRQVGTTDPPPPPHSSPHSPQ